jgi:class 3 adenylate cyclase/tetratricopeptide (TPR) repeat protein
MSKQTGAAPDAIDDVLRRAGSADLSTLMAIWRSRVLEYWARSPEVYRVMSQAILGQGEPLLAYDVITEGLSLGPNDTRLRQLQGLSLARSGATERANVVLEKLRSDGQTDEETLGMLGRTYKDLAMHSDSAKDREQFLRRAAEIYSQGYANTGGSWSGINAGTMNLLIGEVEKAKEIALQVREQCSKAIFKKGVDEYWLLAALGEASLILQEWAQAEEWYARAAQAGAGRFGDLQSTRRNAHLILQHWKADATRIDGYLRVPPVLVFAGHMIDRDERAMPRFPKEIEPAVAKEIRARIEKLKPGFGFASAACGSDILFLEAMLEAGAEVSVVLPYKKDFFVEDSVDFVPGGNWRKRFERVLEKSARVLTASNQRLEIGGVSYDFCNQLLLGLATIRSRQLEAKLIPLAVWDGKSGDGPGGSFSAVANWRTLGYEPEIIDLAACRGGGPLPEGGQRPPPQVQSSAAQTSLPPRDAFGSRLVAILFADAVGFSKLTEAEVPRFVDQFLQAIAQLSAQFSKSIVARNTWGDGLYFVFSKVDDAGNFALELASLVSKTKWEEKGLRAGLNLRIALHAGPAYEFDDPITGRRSYSGTHVSQAARLEPITPPGQVYASEAFAALAAAQRTRGFTCDYVGQTPMAKGYGTLPTYHVRPRHRA